MYTEHQKYVEDVISGVFPGCVISWNNSIEKSMGLAIGKVTVLFRGLLNEEVWVSSQYDLIEQKEMFALEIANDACVRLTEALVAKFGKEMRPK